MADVREDGWREEVRRGNTRGIHPVDVSMTRGLGWLPSGFSWKRAWKRDTASAESSREAWLEIRRGDGGGWDGRKATREEAHAYAACMPRGNNSYDSSGGTANRRCKITALCAMHETEFYGTFRSVPNASPKLVMEIVFPLSPRDSGDRNFRQLG